MSEQFEFNFKLSLEMTWSIYKKSSVMIKFLAYLLDDNAELQKIDIFEKWKKSI